ncbi:MAG: Hsp33 family molecular chaperone HslO, partial [Zoogloea sp.]|nr:Hsp33 family molecular chaperone HslO [Zoogloea sp.]
MSTSTLQRFLLEDLDIRGAIVQLDDVWQALLTGRSYAPAVRDLLGAMSAVACVIGGNLKQAGRLTIQLQGHGPVSLLVVDINESLNLRGYAKASEDAAGKAGISELVGDGQLLLTLDMPGLRHPYQSYVPIEGNSVAEIFEHYLTQSEQQPAALHTAASSRGAACL